MLNLDINVLPTCTLKSIAIADDSEYGTTRIQNQSLEITPPNQSKINVSFAPKQVNVYKSTSLGLSCEDFEILPDGLWTLKYSIFPNTNNFIEKSFFRTELLKCKFGKFLLSLHLDNIDCKKPNFKDVTTLITLIEGITAAGNNCNFDLAYNLYKKANNILDNKKGCECQ